MAYFHPFHQRPYGFATPAPAPHYNFYSAPPPPPAYADYGHVATDFDAEEREALAHLRSIQHRREEAEKAAAARRAHIEHEVAVHRALEREAAIVDARRAEDAQKAQYEAVLRARYLSELKAKAFAQHVANARAQAEARAEAVAEKRRRWADYVHAKQAQFAARQAAVQQARCAGPCAERRHPTETESNERPGSEANGLTELNKLLGLFGIELVDEVTKSKESKPAEKPSETEVVAPTKKTETVATANVEATTTPLKIEKTPATEPTASVTPKVHFAPTENRAPAPTAAEKPSATSFPSELNDLLSNFLGFRLEPAQFDEAAKTNGIPAGLNDFLSQFGLVFEPEEAAEGSEGKGKNVTEDEKPAQPVKPTEPVAPTAEAPVPSKSLTKLDSIAHELHLASESFTFPSRLAFATSSSTTTPPMLFNKTNSGYHAQANKLLQLLLAADGISTGGDREVREKRKEVVRAVEGAIEGLEQKRDAVWEEVRARRERGEESEDEGWSSGSSETASTHEEAHETLEAPIEVAAPTSAPAEVTTTPSPDDAVPTSTEVAKEGYEVPAAESATTESSEVVTPPEVEEPSETKEAYESETVKELQAEVIQEKEDEYELL